MTNSYFDPTECGKWRDQVDGSLIVELVLHVWTLKSGLAGQQAGALSTHLLSLKLRAHLAKKFQKEKNKLRSM